FAEQSHDLSELGGNWNLMGMSLAGATYVGNAGSATISSAGRFTAGSNCQNNTTWATNVCVTFTDALLQLVPPITADGSGGFALVDPNTNTAGERLFAYKAGSGDLMLLTVSRDGSFAFYSPDKPVPLPAIGTAASNWDFDSTALYVPAQAIYETTNTV